MNVPIYVIVFDDLTAFRLKLFVHVNIFLKKNHKTFIQSMSIYLLIVSTVSIV